MNDLLTKEDYKLTDSEENASRILARFACFKGFQVYVEPNPVQSRKFFGEYLVVVDMPKSLFSDEFSSFGMALSSMLTVYGYPSEEYLIVEMDAAGV